MANPALTVQENSGMSASGPRGLDGLGDVKLAAFIGLFLGFWKCVGLDVLAGGSVIGALLKWTMR